MTARDLDLQILGEETIALSEAHLAMWPWDHVLFATLPFDLEKNGPQHQVELPLSKARNRIRQSHCKETLYPMSLHARGEAGAATYPESVVMLAFIGVGRGGVSRDYLSERTPCSATFVPICFSCRPCELNAVPSLQTSRTGLREMHTSRGTHSCV